MKGGLFTCKCDTANCSFSDETINSLHIDSDNEDTEQYKNSQPSKTEKVDIPDDKLSIPKLAETSTTGSILCHEPKSIPNSVSKQKTNCSSPSSNNLQKNDSSESNMVAEPENRLAVKTKTINLNSIVKDKEPTKTVFKQLVKVTDRRSSKIKNHQINRTKLIQDKLQQVILKKGLDDKLSNGNTRTANGKKLFTKKTSSVKTTEKDKLSNGKLSPRLIKSTNNKAIMTYVLRCKTSNSNKKIIENMPVKGTAPNSVFKFSSSINNTSVSISSDGSSKTTQDSNNSDLLGNFVETESTDEESKPKLNEVNGQHNSAKRPGTSASEEVNEKPNDELYIIKSCNDKTVPYTDQDSCSSMGSL